MEAFTVILLLVGIALFLKYRSAGRRKRSIPGPKKYPIVGSALQMKDGSLQEQFYQMARQYGDIFELQLFGTTNIVLNTADMVNKAYCHENYKHIFNNRPDIFIGNHVYNRKSIALMNPGKSHGELRKTLSKGLHVYGDGMPRFEQLITDEIHRVMDKIEKLAGQDFEVVSLTKRSLISVMSIWLIGEQAEESDVENFFEFTTGQDIFLNPISNTLLLNLPIFRHTPLFKPQFDKVMKARERILDKYFYRIKETRTPGQVRGLVDWYLDEQEKEMKGCTDLLLTDEVIKSNILDALTASILTTSSVLPNTMLCLVNHPEYQTKIQDELDRVIGVNREPSVNDKHHCDFLEAVILESMRHIPPVPLLLPHECSEDTEFEGYHVNAKTQLIANIWYIHHDEKIWGDPWAFRPERFLDASGKLLPNSHVNMKSWLPFGVGRRKCPGISLATSRLFLYLSFLLQRWSFRPSPGKCGSCDPRSDNYVWDLQFKPRPFSCFAFERGVRSTEENSGEKQGFSSLPKIVDRE